MDPHSFFAAVKSDFGFSFPRSFRETFNEFVHLLATPDFACRFGDANAVTSADCIRELHALDCPSSIIPFMWVQQPGFRDYYGFSPLAESTDECPVVVFADHAVVHDWPDWDSFVDWVKHH